ncbi:MAG: tRNA lysidine(34) synthetase TilS [Cytophagales bacterium]|nr:tRNA lysidine(34) synthetase TilS [Cytophagales bacterium]
MSEQLLKYVKQLGIDMHARMLLAVSGGLDSMVLLQLSHSLKFDIGVAHVNFKLRGVESDGDAQFVKDWCANHNVPFFTTSFDTNNYAIEHGLSIQMAARELRYQWFNKIIETHQFKYVATAHHLNDSLETALLNLTRGLGVEGLTGIAPLSGNRIRPLLFATRAEIETYAAANQIAWREDSSNQTDAYQRNLIRHRVIPELKKINPSLEQSYAGMVARLQPDLDILNTDVQQWRKMYVEDKGDLVKISKAGLQQTTAIACLWRTLRTYGFNQQQAEGIYAAATGQTGKVFYSSTHCLAVDREELMITSLTEKLPIVSVPLASGMYQLGLNKVEVEVPVLPQIMNEATVAILDIEKLAPTLTWRVWQAGDSFFPLGMEHAKKVSDFLIDEKVPVNLKNRVTVLESNGEIVWVVGYRIDNRFKLTKNTLQAVQFSLIQS